MLLAGKTALITGAAKGIGKGIALELARNGCDIAINDYRDDTGAEVTAAEIRGMGRRSVVVPADVGSASAVDGMFDVILKTFPRLDILVNNAGIQTWSTLLDLKEGDWDRVIATNLKGCFLCTQRAARHMKETGAGRIVNLGSGCNKIAFPNLVDYTASRGAIEMFTKVAAVELAPYGITVNCVAPGAIETERTQKELGDYSKKWASLTPMGRIGTPLDVAKVVVFFAGEASGFVTGQTLWVDGGLFSKPAWPY
jgi:NAD(P)-dependent dehydrogenase (short-subunit alcohol dehydrogenase family)